MTFDELGLAPEVLKAVSETGYTEPTPIQAQAIPHVLAGRDVLGIAQTGTGKTASFTLPMIDKLSRGRARARMPRSLILEPTRELAAQVAENFETYGKYNKLSMALLIGGVSFGDQEKKLDRGVDVLIATPGRLLDHCNRGKVLLTGVQILVIDEADRMLDMGFIPDIEEICKKLPFTRQTLFFSATMPPEIQRLTDTFLHNPERIEVARASSTSANIKQVLLKTTRDGKRDVLQRMIEEDNVKNAIIFCNRKRDVSVLERALSKSGLSAGAIHGDLDQSTRTRTLDGFRNGTIRLLVASDVAARGLDIPDVSHVFNYDVPSHAEDYVHRIGRTGRAGKSGTAVTLSTREDGKYLAAIEKLIGNPIPSGDVDVPAAPAEADASPAVAAEASTEMSVDEPKEEKRSRGRRGGRGRKDKADSVETVNAAAPAEPAVVQSAERARPEPAKAEERPARRERGGRDRDRDDDRPVVGLGDHVPAFILRAVKLPKKSKDTEEEMETEAEDA
ncbi:DEAD/DEAH box helicase domain protein [Parvibaculum lavamentivorans DS-1]|uniref:DEAD-box ATP-dependent RNA helicase RhpA n=1 Tax=Parvibaculum lavamentivorans (strain DS-1 / DSM 13023 / NCIMB 13966) TaxID=402881 RepID=A7HY74_PARL1|nr:DEAD/DEAH box helicase [Parvibaculum lavamentivorans]ABS64857.1 DEAD/DEAH box helicase domain protein [Parvibaculum lavamentivorans DS-1]